MKRSNSFDRLTKTTPKRYNVKTMKKSKHNGLARMKLKRRRQGWAEASKRLHMLGGDRLVWPEFSNPGDDKLAW